MTATTEFVPARMAARLLGVSGHTLRKRLNSGDLPAFVDPLDHRRRLVRLDDLEAFRQPKPREMPRRETAGTAA